MKETEVRIFCTVCDKGMVFVTEYPTRCSQAIAFMMAHMTDYKILAAHKDPHSPADQIEPSYGIELFKPSQSK